MDTLLLATKLSIQLFLLPLRPNQYWLKVWYYLLSEDLHSLDVV
jgi:hypothetical protein